MKRTKKIRKPNPADEPSNDSDTETSPAQNFKRGKTMKLRASKHEKPDIKVTPVVVLKPLKGKTVKARVSQTNNVTVETGTSGLTDVNINGKTEKMKKNIKAKKVKLPEPIVEKSSDNSDTEVKPPKIKKTTRSQTLIQKKSSDDSDSDANDKKVNGAEPELSEQEKSDVESEPEADAEKHKEDLDHLRRVDPEFYDFLKEHDSELLQFSDHESTLEDENDDDRSEQDELHVPGDLHGGSDESDFEAEDGGAPIRGNVTLKMIKDLEAEFQKSKVSLSTITKTVKMFHAAVQRVTSEDGSTEGEYKVTGSAVFNEIINLCVVCLPNAIAKYLGFEKSGKNPQKCKHFVKIKTSLIEYLNDLLALLSAVTSGNILITMLKHLHHLCKYVACFSRISKNAIKKLLPLWSSGQDTVKVLSYMCILRITRHNESTLIVPVLKAMFMTFIKNCKFVSPTTWPGIIFMRRSLVEMFSLDLDQAYPHVFLYVRQLGIHLRNAIVVPKVEHKQAVFNWQYINALHLWAELVGCQCNKHEGMKSLVYPLVMIVSNTIKLGPTSQYYPLRFYLIEVLMMMEKETQQFITIKPFFIDVITKFEINKKHKKASMKPLDFSCIIRLSKSQMNESGFKDAVVEKLYVLLLEYTAYKSHKMVFPDACIVLILFLRELVEKCSNSNHKKKLKQLLDKIIENNEYIIAKRAAFKGSLANISAVHAWENQILAEGTPLLNYHHNWCKVNRTNIIQKSFSTNADLAEVMPFIKSQKIQKRQKEKQTETKESGPVDLFPSDSEDDMLFDVDMETAEKAQEAVKETKKKPKKKKVKKSAPAASEEAEVNDTGDVVSEFTW